MTKGFRIPLTEKSLKENLTWEDYRKVLNNFPNNAQLSYFIKETDSDFVKIGTSTNVSGRLGSLQTGTPHQLVLIGITDIPEKNLHRKFYRLKIRGEWFKYSKEIKDFLKNEFLEIPWKKSMKCPFCKEISTFEKTQIHRYGEAFTVELDDDGYPFINYEEKRNMEFYREEPVCKLICNLCDAELSGVEDIIIV